MKKSLSFLFVFFMLLSLSFMACKNNNNSEETKPVSTKTVTLHYFNKEETSDEIKPTSATANIKYNSDGLVTSATDLATLAQVYAAVQVIKTPIEITDTTNSKKYTYTAVAIGVPKDSSSISYSSISDAIVEKKDGAYEGDNFTVTNEFESEDIKGLLETLNSNDVNYILYTETEESTI